VSRSCGCFYDKRVIKIYENKVEEINRSSREIPEKFKKTKQNKNKNNKKTLP
jgi:hypothetical protein